MTKSFDFVLLRNKFVILNWNFHVLNLEIPEEKEKKNKPLWWLVQSSNLFDHDEIFIFQVLL